MQKRYLAVATGSVLALFVVTGAIGGDPLLLFGASARPAPLAAATPQPAAGLAPLVRLIGANDHAVLRPRPGAELALVEDRLVFPATRGLAGAGDPALARIDTLPVADDALQPATLASLTYRAEPPRDSAEILLQSAALPSPVSPVPDNNTWATLVTGLLLVGMSMRRRQREQRVLA